MGLNDKACSREETIRTNFAECNYSTNRILTITKNFPETISREIDSLNCQFHSDSKVFQKESRVFNDEKRQSGSHYYKVLTFSQLLGLSRWVGGGMRSIKRYAC